MDTPSCWGGVLNDVKEVLGGRPAGRPTDAGGQQPEGVLILNARDERAVAWLIDQAGYEAVQEACGKVAGRRRPYPSNLAKVLGLVLPDSVTLCPSDAALRRIEELRSRFGWQRRGG